MLRRIIAVLSVFGFLGAAPVPPGTPQQSGAHSTYWGVTVPDPYRWLEDASSPNVQAWIDAQNAYADKILAAIPHGSMLSKRLRRLSITGPQQFGPILAGSRLFYMRETPPQAQPVLVVQPWPSGTPRVLVDPNPLGGLTAITDVWPSPNGNYVAYGTASAGTEDTTIHIVDATTGHQMADALPRVGGGTTPAGLAWDADCRGVVYTRLPLPGSVPASELPFNASLYHHTIGSPASTDIAVFGKGLSRVAEYILLNSADGSRVAAVVHFGDGTSNNVYESPSCAGTSTCRFQWKLLATRSDGIQSWDNGTAAFVGNRLLAISIAGTPRGRVVELTAAGPRTIVGEGDRAMRSIAPIPGGFLVTEVWGPDWRIRQFDDRGRFVRTIALPQTGIGIGGIASERHSQYALVEFQGWTLPSHWNRYDSVNGALATIYALKAPADYSNIATARIDASTPDGAKVPVTVLYEKGLARNGAAPAILTAYGAYGLTTEPQFAGSTLAWLERGGIYAVANIRGGGEFGEAWHQAGALLHEQQRFDDLDSAARALIAQGWTSAQHLGIVGGSAGGLLMGGALTQSPQLYRAVVSFVGPYDALRDEQTPNGWMNVTEFGTVTKRDQFKALYAYSPLERVRNGVRYPAILLITGENDPRVTPWHSWKFAARLQSATASRLPVIVLTQRQAGHGVGSSFGQRLSNRAAEFVFFAGQLGLRVPLAAGAKATLVDFPARAQPLH